MDLLETSIFQKYAPILLSAGTAVFAGYQTLTSQPVTTTSFVVFLSLLLTTATTYVLPLTRGKYAGWLKIAFEILGVLFAVALPFFTQNGTLTKANWLLFAVAVGKALLTHFGIKIRTDAALPAAQAAVQSGATDASALVGVLPDPEPVDTDEPKHLA